MAQREKLIEIIKKQWIESYNEDISHYIVQSLADKILSEMFRDCSNERFPGKWEILPGGECIYKRGYDYALDKCKTKLQSLEE